MFKKIYIGYTLLGCLIIVLQCGQTDTRNDTNREPESEFPQRITTESIVISCDPPAEKADSVDHYELAYRPAGVSSWTTINSNIPAVDSPKVTVYRDSISSDADAFYLAVRSVAINGLQSDFHASSDSKAYPPRWYVIWKKTIK